MISEKVRGDIRMATEYKDYLVHSTFLQKLSIKYGIYSIIIFLLGSRWNTLTPSYPIAVQKICQKIIYNVNADNIFFHAHFWGVR